MGKEIHDKSKEKVKETDQKSESKNALNEQALEGRAHPGALKQTDTATQYLPALEMPPGLQADRDLTRHCKNSIKTGIQPLFMAFCFKSVCAGSYIRRGFAQCSVAFGF